MSERVAMVDPRQPRFGQGITGLVLLVGFVANAPLVIPVTGAVLAGASLLGPAGNLYAWLYRGAKSMLGLGPPRELEEAAPPRFANTLGFIFLGSASLALYVFHATAAAWGLALLVSGLALLSAITGLCVGCEAYIIGRRILTRGRVSHRLTAPPPERVGVA